MQAATTHPPKIGSPSNGGVLGITCETRDEPPRRQNLTPVNPTQDCVAKLAPRASEPVQRLRTTCLINNYNYDRFLVEAVDSALAQTVPFDEIIIVDDGSTDASPELLKRKYGRAERVQIIAKPNGGQLSAFNEGFLTSTGDVVFFLDSDDVYKPHYVARALEFFSQRPACDFLFSAPHLFGNETKEDYQYDKNRDFGYTPVLTHYEMPWIGSPTSCLAIRRDLLGRFLPLPATADWRLRADDCLVHGAGFAGGRKFYLRECLVKYRVHGANGFYGKVTRKGRDYDRRQQLERLSNVLLERLGLTRTSIAHLIAEEFCSIRKPSLAQFQQYMKMLDRSCLTSRASFIQTRQMVDHQRRFCEPLKSRRARLEWSLRVWAYDRFLHLL